MKIVIHGATDQNSSNFGDFIYGNELYKICKSLNNEVIFYNPSNFFKKYTEGYAEQNIKVNQADILIYMPGGYFGEVKNASLKRCIKNFIRYMPFGLKGIFYKKKVLIIGLGAGPIYSIFLKLPLKKIVRSAELITVRDNESKRALEKIGAKNVLNYFDMILSFDLYKQGKESLQLRKIMQNSKKILLVHYNHSNSALQIFAEATKKFIEKNSEYMIVVSADSIISEDEENFLKFSKICPMSTYFKYKNPFEFIELLKNVDAVLTCKLHAGVVATMFQKSVISVADHYEKTSRFYKLIGKSERCISLENASVEQVRNKLVNYIEEKIYIPEHILEMSNGHKNELINVLRREINI